MYYSIGRHLSLTDVKGRIIALDSGADRYAAFPQSRSNALRRLLERLSQPDARQEVVAMLRASGLTLPDGETPFIDAVRVPAATARLVDVDRPIGSRSRRLSARADVLRAAARLRFAGFERAILRFGDRGLVPPPTEQSARSTRLTTSFSDFERARPSVPIARRCLVDSLALRETLWRDGIWSDLVIAVQLDPFAAHCWLQAGDLVLNEDVEVARRMTPIRMV